MKKNRFLIYTIIFVVLFVVMWCIRQAAAADAPPVLEVPIDCEVGKVCFIQNYVDRDPDAGFIDYHCGTLGYDGHKGIDIRLPDFVMMDKGVNVLAAAGGTVKGIRNDMPDTGLTDDTRAAINAKECGNGLVVAHADGWETQYCHMKQGSVIVRSGQTITTGQVLGLVGYSGMTEFPHLHLSVRKDGRVVDPFVGVTEENGCNAALHSMWSTKAQAAMAYVPTALLNAGFSTAVPEKDATRHGKNRAESIPANAPMLIFWTDVFGLARNDTASFSIIGPDGSTLVENMMEYDRSKALMFAYTGKKRKEASWPAGTYKGRYLLTRNGKTVVASEKMVVVGN